MYSMSLVQDICLIKKHDSYKQFQIEEIMNEGNLDQIKPVL